MASEKSLYPSPSSADPVENRDFESSCDKACTYCKKKPISSFKENYSITSDHQDQEKKKERREREREREIERERKVLELPPFRSICIKAAEFEVYNQYPECDRNDAMVQMAVRKAIEEETVKHQQARRASIVARNTTKRLSGGYRSNRKPQIDYDHGEQTIHLRLQRILPDDFGKTETISTSSRPEMDERPLLAKMTGVTLFPEVGVQGEGTLEAHPDKFVYKTSNAYFQSQLTFSFENVRQAFIQDQTMPPLLHFQLHHPIIVGTEKAEHIQFRLVPTATREITSHGKILKDFVNKVAMTWWDQESVPPFSFHWLSTQKEFHGRIYKKFHRVFILSFSSIVLLESTPFCAASFRDIEFIHFARLTPGEFDMTVVFHDFNRPVLQIGAIPLDSLNGIKRFLDCWGGLKYYDNSLDMDWGSIVGKIADEPQKFIQEGGWDAYKLEERATSLYYMHYRLELSQA